ncbi:MULTISPECIES: hypothetical protein [Burkholderia cepacia complex]|uniref:Uncharacterized protein n=1 Tax=Burkholderia stabilis TaxID=95485 RepID=A0AAJ5T618_9BURK|nr:MULTISPECIES: hypothetical protein [Burkholderia cepacia complex]VBB13906.1 hypothetical protein BSTAB16_4092 [Burkholderia stabilis]VWB67058.1 hypothetical protein BCO23253_03168 [Burkholderia contaminans]
MTLADIQAVAPRLVERCIVETGPFYERGSRGECLRGGYFTVSGAEFHWYEEGGVAPSCCMSRDTALHAARDSLRTIHAEAA